MNKLAAFLIAAACPACVIHTTGDDGGGGGGGGGDAATISARWSLRNMADGATTACPAGFDTAQLISQPVDANNNPVGDPIVDLFDCAAKAGTSAALPPDVYQVWIEIRNTDGSTLYAQSLSQFVDVRVQDKAFATQILNDGGYFQLSWDLIGNTSQQMLTCSQIAGGVDAVETISTSVADSHRFYTDKFTCEDHVGVTSGLLQGAYTISIDASRADKSIGTAPTLASKVIRAQNQVTDLGHIVIPIDGQ